MKSQAVEVCDFFFERIFLMLGMEVSNTSSVLLSISQVKLMLVLVFLYDQMQALVMPLS